MWCSSQEAFFVPVIARTFETAHIFLLFFCDISADNKMTSHIVYMTSHFVNADAGHCLARFRIKKGFCYV